MEAKRVPNWDGTKESTELYHHGIKGQRWGVRRYQNPDGSLTAAGKARYLRDTSKQIVSIAKESARNNETRFDAAKKITEHLNADSRYTELDSYKDYQSKLQKYVEYCVNGKYKEYFDTPEAEKDMQKAYNATIEYFKKEEPEYLNEIIKNNKGSTKKLDAYHDFRKTLEGYEDEFWSKGEAEYNKKHKKDYDEYKKLETDYKKSRENFAKDICGIYAKKPIKYKSGWSIHDTDWAKTEEVVEYAINYLDDKKK